MRKTVNVILALVVASYVVLQAAGPAIPAPESVFGFKPGTDNRLATYDQTIAYLKKLATASRSIRLVEAGKTTQGRTMYFALISSPANLAKIDRLREIAQRLAHPQNLTDAEARALAREGRAFVHIDGGCHATEVAGPQMAPQLAYNLLTRTNDPVVQEILANDVVMLWPTMNPDGMQMVGEWLAKNAGTPYEQSGLPRLYQEYVGHDNNRDGYMVNMIESRVLEHFWRQWEPHIIYVFHQTAPFPTRIWLPPFSEPVGLHAPPIISREINMIGMAIAQGLDQRGQVGATHMGTSFDAWYPGYVDYAPAFKNIPAFWTETAGNQAAPREYTPERPLAGLPRPSAAEPLLEPVAGRLVAPGGRGELQRDRGDLDARVRREVQGLAPLQPLPGGPRPDREREDDGAVRLRRFRSSSATRWRPSRCCDAWRSAASACRS